MARTFTFTGHSSVLSADFYPPIELDIYSRYGLGLHGFYSYNSILNIDEKNNIIGFKFMEGSPTTFVQIPPGAYELDEINKAIQKIIEPIIKHNNKNIDDPFMLTANNNTLKCEIRSKFAFDLTHKHSLASVVGFENKLYHANIGYESTFPVDIMKVRIIRIDCNIISGAYMNGEEAHTLFEFDIDVEPGFKITKEPQNIIYMTIRPEGCQFIDNITLRILDDNGALVDFRGEKLIVKLELKKLY
jgi:hypothetical protein